MVKKKPHGNKGNPKAGGRKKGTPNKATLERAEKARLQTAEAKKLGLKLGKEVLEEYMVLFSSMAQRHQPMAGVSMVKGKQPNEKKFLTYAQLTVKTAAAVADFQSPKFKAIMVQSAPSGAEPQKTITQQGDNVLPLNDAVAMSRVYQQIIKRVG